MFLRGTIGGKSVDNTTPDEVEAWLARLVRIRPASVMLYPIARATPAHDLARIAQPELEKIAARVRAAGIEAFVY